MAKSMIRNQLGTKTLTSYVPAGNVEAQAFADAVLDGETKVYEEISKTGSGLVDTARAVNVMLQQEDTGAKTYLNFTIPTSKHEGDVIAALETKTFNGVKADKVVVVSMRATTH